MKIKRLTKKQKAIKLLTQRVIETLKNYNIEINPSNAIDIFFQTIEMYHVDEYNDLLNHYSNNINASLARIFAKQLGLASTDDRCKTPMSNLIKSYTICA